MGISDRCVGRGQRPAQPVARLWIGIIGAQEAPNLPVTARF